MNKQAVASLIHIFCSLPSHLTARKASLQIKSGQLAARY